MKTVYLEKLSDGRFYTIEKKNKEYLATILLLNITARGNTANQARTKLYANYESYLKKNHPVYKKWQLINVNEDGERWQRKACKSQIFIKFPLTDIIRKEQFNKVETALLPG